MGNTLTEVTPKLLAQGLLALREFAVMPRLVNTNYDVLAATKGASIDVPIPSAIGVKAVVPAATPASTGDMTPTSASIQLNNWYEAPFHLTDKDLLEAMEGTIPMQAAEAIKALANKVDTDLLSLYKKVYGYAGTAGTTPFASSPDAATQVRRVLNNQLAPLADRRMVIDADAEANALGLRQFQDMSFSGSNQGIVEGKINRKLGFDWFMDQNVQTHTVGVCAAGNAIKAATAIAVGTKTFTVTTSGTTLDLKLGDIITKAGDTQPYVVTTAIACATNATDITVAVEPGNKVATTGGEAITLIGAGTTAYTASMAFHRDAIAFATRPLVDTAEGLGNVIQAAVDPVSGIALRLEISREYKRTRFSYDILYGYELVRRELACRLHG